MKKQAWILLAMFTFVLIAVAGGLWAQGVADAYQAAAQLYRNYATAACTPQAKACYLKQAEYHDCLVRSVQGGPDCGTPPPACTSSGCGAGQGGNSAYNAAAAQGNRDINALGQQQQSVQHGLNQIVENSNEIIRGLAAALAARRAKKEALMAAAPNASNPPAVVEFNPNGTVTTSSTPHASAPPAVVDFNQAAVTNSIDRLLAAIENAPDPQAAQALDSLLASLGNATTSSSNSDSALDNLLNSVAGANETVKGSSRNDGAIDRLLASVGPQPDTGALDRLLGSVGTSNDFTPTVEPGPSTPVLDRLLNSVAPTTSGSELGKLGNVVADTVWDGRKWIQNNFGGATSGKAIEIAENAEKALAVVQQQLAKVQAVDDYSRIAIRTYNGQNEDGDAINVLNAAGNLMPGSGGKAAETGRTETFQTVGINGSTLLDKTLKGEVSSADIDQFENEAQQIPQKVAHEMCNDNTLCNAIATKYEQLQKIYGRLQYAAKVIPVLPGAIYKTWNDFNSNDQ
jgi:hypothetical protein